MKVCVLGANGFIGKNLIHDTNWIGVTRHDLDLMDRETVETYFKTHIYDIVIHCVASIDKQNESTTYKNIILFEIVVSGF